MSEADAGEPAEVSVDGMFSAACAELRRLARSCTRPHLTQTGDVMEQAALPTGKEHILRVHEALEALAKVDQRMDRVVQLRYFAGSSDAEIASVLDVGDGTVRRDLEHARLPLAKALK